MNDKAQSPLNQMLDRIKLGVGQLGKDKNNIARDEDGDVAVAEADVVEEKKARNAPGKTNPDDPSPSEPELSASQGDDLLDDFLDAEVIPVDDKKAAALEKLKSMSAGKKAVLAAVVLAVAFAAKNQLDGGASVAPTSAPGAVIDEAGIPFASESGTAPAPETASGFSDLGLESESPANGFDVNSPLSLDESKPAQADSGLTTDTENAFTPMVPGPDAEDPAPALDAQASPFTGGTLEEASPVSPLAMDRELGLAQPSLDAPADGDSPFGTGPTDTKPEQATFAPALTGTAPANLDSKNPVLESSALLDNAAELKNQLAAKDKAIEELESKLSSAEKQLEAAKRKAAQSMVTSQAQATAPTQITRAARSKPESMPMQRPPATVASKAPARPQLCIAAVAQAARNCSTCVPHAFVSHKGQETMVGHGDFIEGYRVAIQGDRLDLQNSSGEVVHKYWSSPDGCRPN